MEKLLRDWRQDAVNKHQYESAIYIGDKLLAITSKSLLGFLYKFTNQRQQVILKMHSGLLKFISPQVISTELKASWSDISSSKKARHVDILQLNV